MITMYILLIYTSLFLFALSYALLVYLIGKEYGMEGKSAGMVVFGAGVTLLGALAIERTTGQVYVWQVFLCFAASGAPMFLGDVGTYLVRRKNGRRLFPEKGEKDGNDDSAA